MRVNIAIPEAHVTKPVLDAALESVTRLNEQLLERGDTPTGHQLIEQGAQWRPEPPGQEHFDNGAILAQRGWGDCDDWAPLHAASLRKTKEDPGAKAEVVRSGPNMWHAIVKRSNGKIDDPSKAAGMGTNGYGGHSGVHGACLPLMNAPGAVVGGAYIVRPGVAVRPAPQGYQARVDLPWHWKEKLTDPLTPTDYAMTALHTAPVAPMALVGALEGAIDLGVCGGFADPEHLVRLSAISDACQGCDFHELCRKYGEQHAQAAQQVVGSFFGNIAHALTSPITSAAHFIQHPSLSNLTHMATDPFTSALRVAQPLAQMAQPFAGMMRFIPGVGPVAASALDFAAHPPQNLSDLAQFAMHEAPGFIPGVGPMMQMAPQFMQQFAQQQPPQQAPQGYPPQGYPQQAWPQSFR